MWDQYLYRTVGAPNDLERGVGGNLAGAGDGCVRRTPGQMQVGQPDASAEGDFMGRKQRLIRSQCLKVVGSEMDCWRIGGGVISGRLQTSQIAIQLEKYGQGLDVNGGYMIGERLFQRLSAFGKFGSGRPFIQIA